MHGHSRWIVAAAASALAVALSTASSEARVHRHPHVATHPAPPATPPAAPPASVPAPPPQVAPEPPAPAPPQSAASPNGKLGTAAAVFDAHDVLSVLGKDVRSSTGEDMGRLVDIVVDHDGHPRAAVIDFGGFLGVGSRKIAVDWAALDFSHVADKGAITVALSRDQVKSAPEFKDGNPVVVLGALASPPATPAAPAAPAAAPAQPPPTPQPAPSPKPHQSQQPQEK